MNCSACQTPMTSTPMFGERVTVTHHCPSCGFRQVATFDKPETEYNPFAKAEKPVTVGDILTVRHYNAPAHRFELYHYPIIGIKRDRFGRAYYYIPVWNSYMGNFHCYYQDSTFMVSVMPSDKPLSDKHQAAARAFRYNIILGLLERLRRQYHSIEYRIDKSAVATPSLSYPNRMVVSDEFEYEIEKDETMLARISAKKRYYEGLWRDAMTHAEFLTKQENE